MNTANPYAPPRATVQDVADPTATAADRGTRLAAVILDGIIVIAMIYIPLIVAGGLHANSIVNRGIGGLLALAGFVAWCWLTILFISRNGQSIGKKMLGIKVVSADGSPASLGQIIFLRNVVNTVLGVVPFYGLVDALLIFGETRRCVHDRIAGTIVIKA